MNRENTGSVAIGHLSAGKYMVGFGLAVLLTLLSFGLVVTGVLPKPWVIPVLSVAAFAQMLVHLHYFLHLDRSAGMRWNLVALAFTALLLFIFIMGTVWIMTTLNSRMM
ncbi:MAG TPA: cytochrome o ubiquinol oxidase subunit IV [Rectinemataceae bacterium]|nr:cytochrome o ubiquinol oxidase subunit IV [Rectinemataceae bacterium]